MFINLGMGKEVSITSIVGILVIALLTTLVTGQYASAAVSPSFDFKFGESGSDELEMEGII